MITIEEQKQIKQIFKNSNFNSNSIHQILKKNIDIKQILERQYNTNPKQYGSIGKLVIKICKNIQFKKCINCGKQLTYDRTISNSLFCSNKCKLAKNYNPLHTKKHSHWKDFSVEKQKAIKEKKKQTCLKKYGVENFSLLNTYNKLIDNFKDYVQPLFEQKQYKGYQNEYKWKCKICGEEFLHNIHTTNINQKIKYLPRCPFCYPQKNSSKQCELVDFLKTIFKGQIIINTRRVISPLELDIVLPELKLAIQFNGTYWHSSIVRKKNNYHINKTELCQKAGYRLIHIFEHEWKTKRQIIKQKLKSIICKDIPSIYGRKCQIKQINSKQKNEFLNKYHIQGQDKSNIKLGLFYQNQLVGVMTFNKPRFNKNYQWQLSRYATKYRVIGGASKLLKYFQKIYNPKSIITYADRRFSIGNLYYKLGFKLLNVSKPNYFYVKNDSTNILTRYQCQKHKLKQLLGQQNFDQNLSQKENMQKNGFYQIFDCGNYVFDKKIVY